MARATGGPVRKRSGDRIAGPSDAPGHRVRLVELAERMLWSKSRLAHHLDQMTRRNLGRRAAHGDGTRATDRSSPDTMIEHLRDLPDPPGPE